MESDSGSESESSERNGTSLIPRGGPIYLPNMVGNLSTVPEFQSSFLSLLQDLDTHLSLESTSSSQQFDISYVFTHQLALSFISGNLVSWKQYINICNWADFDAGLILSRFIQRRNSQRWLWRKPFRYAAKSFVDLFSSFAVFGLWELDQVGSCFITGK